MITLDLKRVRVLQPEVGYLNGRFEPGHAYYLTRRERTRKQGTAPRTT